MVFQCCPSEETNRRIQILHRPEAYQPAFCCRCLLPAPHWWNSGRFGRSQVFHLSQLEVQLLASGIRTRGQAVHRLHCGTPWLLRMQRMPFGIKNGPATFQWFDAEGARWPTFEGMCSIPWWQHHLHQDGGGTWADVGESVSAHQGCRAKAESKKVPFFFRRKLSALATLYLKRASPATPRTLLLSPPGLPQIL